MVDFRRRGAAIVELAVCLPVIALIVFASLEGANMLFVRQATVQAAMKQQSRAADETGLVLKRTDWPRKSWQQETSTVQQLLF